MNKNNSARSPDAKSRKELIAEITEKLHAKENLDKDHPVDRRTKEVEPKA